MNIFEYDKYKFSTKVPLNLALEDITDKREEEINRLKEELLKFNILIKDLIHEQPSYIIRNKILNIAYFIIEDIELLDFLNTTKKFPVNRLIKMTPVNKEFYEEWKHYIVTYVIIFADPRYTYLQEYLQIEKAINVPSSEEIIQINKDEEYTGIILHKGFNYGIILTSKGEFIKVNVKKENKVGEVFSGKESFRLKKYKLQISIALSVIMLILVTGIFQYRTIDKTISIETTSLITIEINKFNKVINSYSRTEKGNNMLRILNIKKIDIDKAIEGILNYAIDNEMIPDRDIVITVTGNALKANSLKRTEKFILDEGLQVKMNNSGYEYKVSP